MSTSGSAIMLTDEQPRITLMAAFCRLREVVLAGICGRFDQPCL